MVIFHSYVSLPDGKLGISRSWKVAEPSATKQPGCHARSAFRGWIPEEEAAAEPIWRPSWSRAVGAKAPWAPLLRLVTLLLPHDKD